MGLDDVSNGSWLGRWGLDSCEPKAANVEKPLAWKRHFFAGPGARVGEVCWVSRTKERGALPSTPGKKEMMASMSSGISFEAW